MFKKPLQADLLMKVPFYDVDQMEVVWHGHYLKYFERARCDLLELFDYGYAQMRDSGYAWPVVDIRTKYIKPARFNRDIRITAELVEFENRLKINYVIYDVESGERLTKGYSVQVAVDMANEEMLYVSPPTVRERLECHGYL